MSTILTFSIIGGILVAAAAVALAEADKSATDTGRTDATPATTRLLDWFRRTGATIGAGLAGMLRWARDNRPRRAPRARPSAGSAADQAPAPTAGATRAPTSDAGVPSERARAVAVLGEPVGEVVPSARPTWGQRIQSFLGLLVLIALLGVGTALVVGVLIATLGDLLDGVVG